MKHPWQLITIGIAALGLLVAGARAEAAPELHQAIMDQDRDRVASALESGADTERRFAFTQRGHSGARFHLSPLELAVTRDDQAIIRLLARHGADLYAVNDLQMTALEWAIRFRRPANARLLWELSDGETYRRHAGNALRLAFVGEDTPTFQWLLDAVATPQSIDELFAHFAKFGTAGKDRGLPAIRRLLALGLKPSYGALLAAVRERNLDTTRALLDTGLSIDGAEGDWPPLHVALFGHETSVAEYLLARGADPDRRDPYGRTPAMTVVRVRSVFAEQPTEALRARLESQVLARLRLLASFGADLALTDAEGRTLVEYVDDGKDPDFAYSREQLRRVLQR